VKKNYFTVANQSFCIYAPFFERILVDFDKLDTVCPYAFFEMLQFSRSVKLGKGKGDVVELRNLKGKYFFLIIRYFIGSLLFRKIRFLISLLSGG
jgi:hypothetical protein